LARAAKKAAKRSSKAKKASSKVAAATVDTSWPITPGRPPPGRAKDPVVSSAIEEAVEEALHPPKPDKPRGSSKKQAAAKKAPPQKSAKAKKDAPRGKAKTQAQQKQEQNNSKQRKQRSVPPPAVNEPLAFINFVAAFSVGSTIDGEVVSFTSHGAMVDVSLPGGGVLHCYIPLAAMGTPPPTKARKVLKKGEVRPFVLAGLDPPRRVAELALPIQRDDGRAQAAPTPAKRADNKDARAGIAQGPTRKRPDPTRKAAAKKGTPPRQKAAAKKGPPAAKTATAKKQAKKAPSKRAKAPAATAPAKKTAKAKKVAKTAAVKAPARKSAKTAGNRSTSAKKVPAKKTPKARA
jgi:hypothetical protein